MHARPNQNHYYSGLDVVSGTHFVSKHRNSYSLHKKTDLIVVDKCCKRNP